jgi:hypothetical protein
MMILMDFRMYTGQVARDIPTSGSLAEDWLFLCNQWKLTELANLIKKEMEVEEEKKEGILHQVLAKRSVVLIRDIKGVQRDLFKLYEIMIEFGDRWCRRYLGKPEDELNGEKVEMDRDGNEILGSEKTEEDSLNEEKAFMLLDASSPDCILEIDGIYFPCHKAFLTRSEYFKALLLGGFFENSGAMSLNGSGGDGDGSPESKVMVKPITLTSIPSAEVFEKVLEFLYTVCPLILHFTETLQSFHKEAA